MKKILVIAMVLAMVAVMVVPLAVSASGPTAPPASTEIDASITAVLELQAPSGITLSGMAIGTNSGSSLINGVVKCNDPSGYNVHVNSNRTDGKMVSATGPHTLGAALLVTTGSITGQIVTSTSNQQVVTSSVPDTSGIALSVSQAIAYTDYAEADYSLTLTYTATVGP